MRQIVAALVALVVVTGCGLFGEGAPVEWPKLAECGPGPGEIVTTVTRVLLDGGNVSGALEQLARSHGTDAVVCAVDLVRERWARPGAAMSEERMAAIGRADVWFSDIGTTVQR